jgi:lysozyme
MKTPKMTREEIAAIVSNSGVCSDVVIVGIRGYYRDSMGIFGKNDRGIYDDAIFVLSPNEFQAFQANVDPSVFRKGIANLKVGVYKVVKWIHKGKYAALQIVRDTVLRDGETNEDSGRHGINFHYGSETQTWSEGCQTLPRSIYWNFLNLVYSEMQKYHLDSVQYILIDNK